MEVLGLILFGAALALALVWAQRRYMGFRAQSPDDYATTGPEFDLRRHLNGPILCEGVIYGPTGRVSSRFVADFEASWDRNVGRMTEESGGDVLDATEWMYLVENGTIMNRSQFRKFGITVAELVATMRPKEAA